MARHILIVTPAAPGSRSGNRVTAERWEAILSSLGHEVAVSEECREERCDLLVALHAARSAASVARYRERAPHGALVVCLTGTDLYRDLPRGDETARRSLEAADRIVTLHRLAVRDLPAELRDRVRTIHQSVTFEEEIPRELPADRFRVCVAGHLREVKDPFRTARAARLLPARSRIEVIQIGGAMTEDVEKEARAETRNNPRYSWLGELDRHETLARIASSHLLSLTSRMEGGANVLGEAIALGTPAVVSAIPGSLGILGEDYPATFPVGDTEALARLLLRVETDEPFRRDLETRIAALAPLFEPSREARAWRQLLDEIDLESVRDERE